jgi:hypothetical protein
MLLGGGAILVAFLAAGCGSHSQSLQNTTTTSNVGTKAQHTEDELFITRQPYNAGYEQGKAWRKSGKSLHQLWPTDPTVAGLCNGDAPVPLLSDGPPPNWAALWADGCITGYEGKPHP